MKVDPRNLQIKLFRGRTQTIATRIGYWSPNTTPPAGSPSATFVPGDITNWWFAFTMRTNFTKQQPVIAVQYNPIQNLADPSQGQLMFEILGSDTEPLQTGNYVFDMAVDYDGQPRFFCGGTVSLSDNVTDTTPPSPTPANVKRNLILRDRRYIR